MNFTYGAELELPDIDCNVLIPEHIASYNLREDFVMNSNGIAADCKKRLINIGSEINLTPTSSIDDTIKQIEWLYDSFDTKTNHFAALHIHIGLPEEIRNDLQALRKLVSYTFQCDALVADRLVNPPAPTTELMEVWTKQLTKWRKKTYPLSYKKRILEATSVEEMGNCFQPMSKGRRLTHLVSRVGINTRSIWDRGTVEFRLFSGTDDLTTYRNTFQWCHDVVANALGEQRDIEFYLKESVNLPSIPLYKEYLQKGMIETGLGLNKRGDVKDLIWQKFLNGEIDKSILGSAYDKMLSSFTC